MSRVLGLLARHEGRHRRTLLSRFAGRGTLTGWAALSQVVPAPRRTERVPVRRPTIAPFDLGDL